LREKGDLVVPKNVQPLLPVIWMALVLIAGALMVKLADPSLEYSGRGQTFPQSPSPEEMIPLLHPHLGR
jgi:hypothetical protein